MIDRNHPRYLAVYGASVALHTFTRLDRGLPPVDDAGMTCFVEEAHAVAEHAERSQPDADEVALQAQRDRVLGAAVRAWRCECCHYPCTFGDTGFVTTCAKCAESLKTLVAKLIAAELPPASACVPSIEGARGLDSLTDAQSAYPRACNAPTATGSPGLGCSLAVGHEGEHRS